MYSLCWSKRIEHSKKNNVCNSCPTEVNGTVPLDFNYLKDFTLHEHPAQSVIAYFLIYLLWDSHEKDRGKLCCLSVKRDQYLYPQHISYFIPQGSFFITT